MRFARLFAMSTVAFALLTGSGRSADIKILSTRAVMTILETVGPDFERQTGHKLHVSSDVAINQVRRIMAGEAFDLLIASPQSDGRSHQDRQDRCRNAHKSRSLRHRS